MIRQATLLVLAVVIVALDAESFRRRRQVSAQSPDVDYPCSVQCSWKLSQAWAKVVGFDDPTPNMVSPVTLPNGNDTFRQLCGLFAFERQCAEGCIAANSADSAVVNQARSQVSVCEQTSDFDQYLPCIAQNASIFRRACKKENEGLLAATTRMATQTKVDSAAARQLCKVANVQAYCIFPVVRQTCGENVSDLFRSVVNASLSILHAAIEGNLTNGSFPECADYFDTIQNGIPMAGDKTPAANSMNTTSVPFVANSTSSINSTLVTVNSTLIAINSTTNETDLNVDDRRANPRQGIISTTADSSASVISFTNHILFFAISILFYISMH